MKTRELRTDAELLAASLIRALVVVVDHDPFDIDEVLEPGGLIEAYTQRRVCVNGEWYPRKYCSFRILE